MVRYDLAGWAQQVSGATLHYIGTEIHAGVVGAVVWRLILADLP